MVTLQLFSRKSEFCLAFRFPHRSTVIKDPLSFFLGSENNQLYLYYKGLSDPLIEYDFGCADPSQSPLPETEGAPDFVSAVCWKKVNHFY